MGAGLTHDAIFNITAVLDTLGAVIERYHHTPYGKQTVLDADFPDDADGASDIANPFTFTGRRFDEDMGLFQYRNRVLRGRGREVRVERSDWV